MKRGIFSFLLLLGLFVSSSKAEFKVSSHTTNDQTDAAIAMDANGDFTVVWSSYRHPGDGNSGGVFGRRFDKNCEPNGGEFRINTTTLGNQTEPDIGMDANGNFIVVWHGPQSVGQEDEDIYGQRLNANGVFIGGEFRINSITNSRQMYPSISMTPDGRFVVVWESQDYPEPGKISICGQLYDKYGAKVGGEFKVNIGGSTCRYPAVATERGGGFVIVWLRDSSGISVRVRHYNADGNAPYGEMELSTEDFTSLTEPVIAIDDKDNYVVAWDGNVSTFEQDDIYIRKVHWTHCPLHQPMIVNTSRAGAQSKPSLAMTGNGQFVVIWQGDTNSPGNPRDIYGQRFAAPADEFDAPVPLGGEFRVNTYLYDEQKYSDIAITDNGRFAAVWQSNGQDGSGYGIYGQAGPIIKCADFSGDGFVNFYDYCKIAEQWCSDGNWLEADLLDDDTVDGQDLDAFCGQWLLPCYTCAQADINNDGRVNFIDYALWVNDYQKHGPLSSDVTGDGTVDMADLRAIAFHWASNCN